MGHKYMNKDTDIENLNEWFKKFKEERYIRHSTIICIETEFTNMHVPPCFLRITLTLQGVKDPYSICLDGVKEEWAKKIVKEKKKRKEEEEWKRNIFRSSFSFSPLLVKIVVICSSHYGESEMSDLRKGNRIQHRK